MNYSHSRIGTFENCKYQYKLRYIDRVKVDTPTTIEMFLGSQVHDTLEKLYKDLKYQKLLSIEQLLDYYNKQWKTNYSKDILIVKKEYTANHYKKMGEAYIKNYYNHYHPFDEYTILGLETNNFLKLKDKVTYSVRIDKLASKGNTYYVCDYKTNGRMFEQEYADKDRQLAMYSIWVKEKYPDAKKVVLLWHMLAFDKEVKSTRTDSQLKDLKKRVLCTIKEMETCINFPTNVTKLCDYCVYKELCPSFSHEAEIEQMTLKQFSADAGVQLVDEYVELSKKKSEASKKLAELKDDLIEYSKQHKIDKIYGKENKVSVKEFDKYSFEDKEKVIAYLKKHRMYDEFVTLSIVRLSAKAKEDKKLAKLGKKEKDYRLSVSKNPIEK